MPVNSERRDNAQTTILALLLSQKGGCTLQQLCKDYYEEEGESVPWKELGYVSLLSFIHSMSKVVQVENRSGTIFVKGVASDKSKHVSKLVAGQKDKRMDTRKSYRPSHYYPNTVPQKVRIPVEVLAEIVSLVDLHPEGVNMDYVFNEVRRHMPFVNISLIDLIEQIQALSHKIFVAHNKVFPIRSKSNCLAKLNDTNMYLPESRSMVSNEGELESVVVTAGGNEDSYIMNNYDEEYDCEFLPSGYVNSTPYTKSSAKAKPTSNFIQETVSKQYDNNVEHKFTEHDSRVHTDQNTAYDMFKCNNTDNAQAYMQFSNNVDEENETYLYGKNVETLISDRVKIRLEKLIQNHSNGIWCADLPAKYLEEYRVPLNYMELGFSSVREFTSHLPEIFHCVQPRDAEDFILYDAKKEILANSTKEQHPVVTLAELHQIYPTDDEIEPIPTTVSLNTCQELIPDNVMTIGETVGYLSVTSLVPEEKPYIEVFVVEVFTPSFFWIQLRKKQRKFKNFMDDLHNFYTMNHEQYVIPSVVLEKGLNCACVYNKIWHRGIIKTVNHDLQVTVMFYDYGTLKTYPPEAIRYLHKRFSPLSAQAIPCGLINTKCYNGSKWSRSATHAFAVRTSHVPLIATVASTNIEDNSMMVTLTDTLGDEDVHINDWLVERKLAKHGKMVCMKTRNFLYRYYLECKERSEQKSGMIQVSKTNKLAKSTKSILFNGYSKHKVALYDSNTGIESSSENTLGKTDDSRVDSLLNRRAMKEAQSLKCRTYTKSYSSEQETRSPSPSFEKMILKRPESLYDKLVSLRQKSPSNKNNNIFKENVYDNEQTIKSLNASSLLENRPKHKLNDRKPSATVLSSSKKGICDITNTNYDILNTYSDIPKAYAYYFDIRDSGDESDDVWCTDISADASNEQYALRHMDWSIIHKNVERRKGYVPELNAKETIHELSPKKRDDVPLAEGCFLKAVRKSDHFVPCDDDVRWRSTGNINKAQDASPLILRNLKALAATSAENVTVAIRQKTLERLTGIDLSTKSFESLTSTSVSVNTSESSRSSQETSSITSVVTSNSTSDNDIVDTKHSESNFADYTPPFESYYLCVKPITPNYKLLRMMSELQSISNETSALDSDDISVSTVSGTPENSTDTREEESETEEGENVAANAEFDFGPDVTERSASPLGTKKTDFNIIELCEELVSMGRSVSPVISISVDDSVSADERMSMDQISESDSSQSLLSDKSVLKVEVEESINKSVETEESLSSEITVSAELVPLRESLTSETLNIPTFNDIDVESNEEEEWDVDISFANVHDFLKIHSPFYKSIESRLAREFKEQPKIVEADDSNDYTKEKFDIADSTDRITNNVECLSVEFENVVNGHEKSAEIDTSVASEGSVEINNNESFTSTSVVPWNVQGKAKTLVGMLNKAKSLQCNRDE